MVKIYLLVIWNLAFYSHKISSLRMCLVEGEIGWTENFKEKIGREIFFVDIWLEGRGEKNWCSPSVFSPNPPKCFLCKMERKSSGRNLSSKWACPMTPIHCSFFFFFAFFCDFFLDVIFFSRYDFYFLINLGDCFFFCHLFILIGHHFLIRIHK